MRDMHYCSARYAPALEPSSRATPVTSFVFTKTLYFSRSPPFSSSVMPRSLGLDDQIAYDAGGTYTCESTRDPSQSVATSRVSWSGRYILTDLTVEGLHLQDYDRKNEEVREPPHSVLCLTIRTRSYDM